MSKLISFKVAALSVALATTGIAHANTFSYDTQFGGANVRLTIDTVAGTASYVGGGTNVTFSGANFSSFTSIDTNDLFRFTSVSGVVNDNGRVFTPVIDNRTGRARLRFRNNGASEIWSGALNEDGRRVNFDIDSGPLTLAPVPSSSTSTGGLGSTGGVGSTGGNPTGGSTGGGTDVPAPGAIALLGLGMAGLAFGRRRRKNK